MTSPLGSSRSHGTSCPPCLAHRVGLPSTSSSSRIAFNTSILHISINDLRLTIVLSDATMWRHVAKSNATTTINCFTQSGGGGRADAAHLITYDFQYSAIPPTKSGPALELRHGDYQRRRVRTHCGQT